MTIQEINDAVLEAIEDKAETQLGLITDRLFMGFNAIVDKLRDDDGIFTLDGVTALVDVLRRMATYLETNEDMPPNSEIIKNYIMTQGQDQYFIYEKLLENVMDSITPEMIIAGLSTVVED
jgi:hypothetical protein